MQGTPIQAGVLGGGDVVRTNRGVAATEDHGKGSKPTMAAAEMAAADRGGS
jgi:hypothetical protein